MKRVILLGASGSIGTNTLDVLSNNTNDFSLVAISVHNQVEKIEEVFAKFPSVKYVAVSSNKKIDFIKKNYPFITFYEGKDSIENMLKNVSYDILVNALTGFAGLKPSLIAIEQNKIIALSNKETLVVGGELVKDKLSHSDAKIFPIDSEHAALFHLLSKCKKEEVRRVFITCSGGALRDIPLKNLYDVDYRKALNHPQWKMGPKITIDSATLLNKAYEVIEAHYLFDINVDDVNVLMHKESVIHAMVELVDGSFIAHLGPSDMRPFIQYALYEGQTKLISHIDNFDLPDLHFFKKDDDRYPLFHITIDAYKTNPYLLCVINAASEVLVSLYLCRLIKFGDISRFVNEEIIDLKIPNKLTYADLIKLDKITRARILWKVVFKRCLNG